MSNVRRHNMRSLLLATIALLIGCATRDPAPEYNIGPGSQQQTRLAAQQSFIEAIPSHVGSAQLDAPLKMLAAPMPDYPKSFRDANIVGSVRIRFTVETNGTVSNPTVIGSPPPELAALCLHAVLQWKFEPPRRGGQPATFMAEQNFAFQLE